MVKWGGGGGGGGRVDVNEELKFFVKIKKNRVGGGWGGQVKSNFIQY